MTRSVLVFAIMMGTTAPAAYATQFTIFSDSGQSAADIQDTVDAFRSALDPFNPPNPVAGDPQGRRQIDWDAAPDAVSDPNAFPGDFFNFNAFPRARGIEFQSKAGPGGADGFQLSSTEASGEPIEFGRDDDFTVFSPERLFAPTGGNLFDVEFFLPEDPDAPAGSRGLGVVFTDNDYLGDDGFSNASFALEDINGTDLGTFYAEPSPDAGLSFLGVIFDEPFIRRAMFDVGTIPIDLMGIDSFSTDFVAMDDFIFGEPTGAAVAPIPLPAGGLLLSSAFAVLLLGRRFRS